jgi:hypothetical protein
MRKFINIVLETLEDDQTEFPFLKDFQKYKDEKNAEQHQQNVKSNTERLQRARDLGFNVDDPHYFGTPNGDFDEMDLDRTPDERLAYGRGAYNSRDPDAASGYSKAGSSWGNDIDDEPLPTVYKVFLKVKNPFDLDKIYPYSEVKRIFTHCYSDDELRNIDFFTELAEEANDYEYMEPKDEDSEDELAELDSELFNIDYMTAEDLGINPENYDDGENDSEYLDDIEKEKENERKYIQQKIDRIVKRRENEIESKIEDIEKGRIATAYGKNIYEELWKNTDDYSDWKHESNLIGGESDVFEFKTIANKWLEELGYDGVKHIDHYNPGNNGQSHGATIAFHPHQVRSVHANFDPKKKDSPKLSETKLKFSS